MFCEPKEHALSRYFSIPQQFRHGKSHNVGKHDERCDIPRNFRKSPSD
jgi:hypothetical protein